MTYSFPPRRTSDLVRGPGGCGFMTGGIKDITETKVGDTITEERRPTDSPLPGFKPSFPVVFCGIFPVDAGDFDRLRDSLGKLSLNDASFHYEAETSAALGFGFRCGFQIGRAHV